MNLSEMEEIFGPVLVMTPFDTEEEAIALANDTPYGLTNYVQTADKTRARQVARGLRQFVDVDDGLSRRLHDRAVVRADRH